MNSLKNRQVCNLLSNTGNLSIFSLSFVSTYCLYESTSIRHCDGTQPFSEVNGFLTNHQSALCFSNRKINRNFHKKNVSFSSKILHQLTENVYFFTLDQIERFCIFCDVCTVRVHNIFLFDGLIMSKFSGEEQRCLCYMK